MGRTRGHLVPAALLLAAASFGSRIVGLVRERVLTSTFGAGDTFDAFVAAFRVPDFIFNLIVVGALSAAFIPLFTEKLVRAPKGKEEAFRFATMVMNVVLVWVLILSVLYIVLAPWIVPLIAPGFGDEKLELTVQFSRIMAFQPIFLAISFVFSGVLNSFKRFAAYALAPIVYNAGIIIGVVFLVPFVGVMGLAWGVVIGAFLHMAIQLPSVLQVGFRWRTGVPEDRRDMQRLWRMMVPRVFGLAAQQVNLFVVTILGSSLVAGSVTAFHLANNVQYLPVGIFGLAFAQAAFPTLAELYSRGNRKGFLETLMRNFRYILFFVIPISVFFLLLRAQIIRVLFGAGAFDWEDTLLTFQTFTWLIVSIFAQATIPLLTRAFYVQHNVKTPVIISLIGIVINVVLAVVLTPVWGVQGLAMAFSLSAVIHLGLLLGRLHWEFGDLDDRAVLNSLWRISLAAILAGLVVQGLKYPVAMVVDMQRFWGVATQLMIAGLGGVGAYVGVGFLLRIQELSAMKQYLPKKLFLPSETDTTWLD